jgi:putative acetyltransferase
MMIRRAVPTDRDVLLDIWLRSVRATHTFLSEEDVQTFLPFVRNYLGSDATELWVLDSESGAAVGIMGMGGGKIEALFLAPEFHRRPSP